MMFQIDEYACASIIERKTQISELIKNPIDHHNLSFRNDILRLDVISVPINLPAYRLQNGRTKSAQREFIKLNNLPEDYFSEESGDLEKQRAQHGLLLNLVDKANEI